MKTKLLLILLLLSLTTMAQTNLVPNGNFETWTSSSQPDSWYRYFSGYIAQSTIAQNGSSSTNMIVSSGTFNYINSEYFAITANKTYRITLYHKVVSGTFSSLDLSLYHKPGTFKQEIIKKTDVAFSTTEWRKVEFEYTATVSENIEVDIWATGTLNSEILVDNISVIDVAEIEAQYTIIPDAKFEAKLIALGIDTGVVDGKVLTNSINKLTSLNVSSSSIADLTGIQDFVALTHLICDSNKLTSVDFSKNTNLTLMNCSNNQLTNLDVSQLFYLSTLYFASNQLISINVSKNVYLTSLDCYSNKLTSLDVSKNVSLYTLECSKNELTSLDVSKNLRLNSLGCYSNQLTSLDVANNSALDRLACYSNQLTELDLSSNTKLTNLQCHLNLLKNINLLENELLTNLYCSSNQLTNLDLSKALNLKILICNNNNLSSLDLNKNTSLNYFSCNNNKLSILDISKNTKLKALDCSSNSLYKLNIKNGNNANFNLNMGSQDGAYNYNISLNFKNNNNLQCIEVDNVAYSNTNWTPRKDATATYNTSCPTLGLQENYFDKIFLYPNPTNGKVYIGKVSIEKANVYNTLGQLVKSFTLNSHNTDNIIDLSGLPKGVYYVYLINQNAASAKKVIVK